MDGKLRLNTDRVKPFSGDGDVVARLAKVKLFAKLSFASFIPLFFESDASAIYLQLNEAEQRMQIG